jgi:hypothetical protein
MTSVATYYGDTEDEDRQNRGRLPGPRQRAAILCWQPTHRRLRFDPDRATTVIYYSNSFDLEVRLQSEDRAHRIGQTNKVTYVDLIAKDTVDEHIVKALGTKSTSLRRCWAKTSKIGSFNATHPHSTQVHVRKTGTNRRTYGTCLPHRRADYDMPSVTPSCRIQRINLTLIRGPRGLVRRGGEDQK